MAPLELDAVVVEGDAQASLSKVSSVSKRSPFRIPPLVRTKDEEPEDEKDEDRVGGDEEKKAETEALQEARQLAQMRVALKIFMRTVTLFCVGGTAFLIVRESKITTRVGGAKPWRWGVVCSLFFGGRMILNWLMDLVMMALDRKHVVAKRISFIIGGIYDQLVSTMYYITLRVTWGLLLRDASRGEWSEMHLLVARLASCFIAHAVIHTFSKGVARYMEVYFQREAYFNPIVKALAEEFVVVTLLAMCSVDMRQWHQDHDPGPDGPNDGSSDSPEFLSSPTSPRGKGRGAHALARHFQKLRRAIAHGQVASLTSFLRLAKDELPIKTDMIVMKEGSIEPADLSLARMHRMGSHIRRKKLRLPEKFVKNANQAFVRGDLPKLVDADIVHRAVAKTAALRAVAVMRQLQGARRFVPLDHHFFDRLGIPAEVREKIMEVLDTENAGVLRREQIVRRFVEIYERRRDLAKSLASTTSVLATLERIILSALYFLLVFIVLGIFDQNIVEMWFTASSMLLAFVFMFGNSIKQLFESVIFIFVIHPFDVGDAVLIEGERHAIRNIGILTTETVKWNGQVIYYPNMSMSTKPLTNLTRMKKFTDEQTWVVDIATPAHVLEAMPLYFHKWAMDHAEDFHEITPRIYSHAHDPLKIKITLYYEYTFNGLPPSRAGNARDQLGLAMRKFLLDNNVVYRQQTLPVEIINGVNGRSSIVGGGGGGGGDGAGWGGGRDASRGRSPSRGPSRRTSVSVQDAPSVFLDLATSGGGGSPAVKTTGMGAGTGAGTAAGIGSERMATRDDALLARASG